jgi:hypothetical protein
VLGAIVREMRGRVVVVLLVVSSGCAALFQERYSGDYDYQTAKAPPRCTQTRALAVVDGLVAGLEVAGAVLVLSDDTRSTDERTTVLLTGLVEASFFAISGVTGAGYASRCQKATSQWKERMKRERVENPAVATNPKNEPALTWAFWCDRDDVCFGDTAQCGADCLQKQEVWCAVNDDQHHVCGATRYACLRVRDARRDRFGECVKRLALMDPPKVDPKVSERAPRGYYCATNSVVGTCAREKQACELARTPLVAVAADLSVCALAESAWCFDDGKRCAPGEKICIEQRTAALWTTDECVEKK